MKTASLVLLCLLPLGWAAAQTPVPETFESSFNKPFRTPGMNKEKFPNQRIEGRMAMPWNDDSAWCDVEVEYQTLTENPGEGANSQRIVSKRVPSGSRVQFGLTEFPLVPGKETRIRFLAKSPDYTPVTLNIGQRKPPYASYFSQRIQPSAEWSEIEILVPGQFDDAESILQFYIMQAGTFDLDHFRVERRESKAAMIPDERLANLLPSSSFPLGAAPPWIAHAFAKTEVGELRGPTGIPALVLDVRKQPGFAPFEQSLKVAFRAVAGKPVTVRVSADLLEGEADIALRAGVEKIWEKPFGTHFALQKGWKTYEHKVDLPPSARGYYLLQVAFEGSARVAVDRVQVTQSSADFALTGPVELAVDSTAPLGLAVDDEPFGFRLAAWGNLEAAKSLVATLSDLSGQTKEIARYPVPATAFEPVTTEFPMPSGLPTYGSFRMEVQAVNAAGEPLGVPAELLLHRVRKARSADAPAPDSPFGIHYYTSHLDATGLATVKKLGFNWLRLFKSFSWKRVEAKKGEFDFAQTDNDVRLLAENNLLALGVLGDGSPAWAAKSRDPNFKGWACWTPRDLNEFADYAGKIFERYGDKVTAFEPWNEPYYPGFFTERTEGGKRIIGPAEEYLALQKLIFERARASGKNLQIGWNTNAMEEMARNRELIGLGILPYTDFISIHHYLGQPDPAPELRRQVTQMRESMGGVERPIWNTEGGLGPFASFNLYKHIPPFQDNTHHLTWAEWYARYWITSLSAGVKRYFTYLWAAPNFWSSDYAFNNIDGRLSPNLTAMSALAWQIEGTGFVKSLPLSDGAQAEIFEGAGRSVACVIPIPGKPRKIPADPALTAYDLFGNKLAPGSAAPPRLHYIQSDGPGAQLITALEKSPAM